MHNRARMIVASFLTKDLYLDWRWGAALLGPAQRRRDRQQRRQLAMGGGHRQRHQAQPRLQPDPPGPPLRPRRRLRAPLPAGAGGGRGQGVHEPWRLTERGDANSTTPSRSSTTTTLPPPSSPGARRIEPWDGLRLSSAAAHSVPAARRSPRRRAEHGAAIVQRHGGEAYVLPHEIDHVANLRALVEQGCDRVLAISSVGSLDAELPVGSLLCPDDFIALHVSLSLLRRRARPPGPALRPGLA